MPDDDDDKCPGCNGPSPGGAECGDCQRAQQEAIDKMKKDLGTKDRGKGRQN